MDCGALVAQHGQPGRFDDHADSQTQPEAVALEVRISAAQGGRRLDVQRRAAHYPISFGAARHVQVPRSPNSKWRCLSILSSTGTPSSSSLPVLLRTGRRHPVLGDSRGPDSSLWSIRKDYAGTSPLTMLRAQKGRAGPLRPQLAPATPAISESFISCRALICLQPATNPGMNPDRWPTGCLGSHLPRARTSLRQDEALLQVTRCGGEAWPASAIGGSGSR